MVGYIPFAQTPRSPPFWCVSYHLVPLGLVSARVEEVLDTLGGAALLQLGVGRGARSLGRYDDRGGAVFGGSFRIRAGLEEL